MTIFYHILISYNCILCTLYVYIGVVSAIIFVNDPHRVDIVCQQLLEMNLVAAPLSGDSSKDDRKVCKV